MADIQIADDKLDELFMEWRSQRTAASMRAFVDGMNAIIEDRGNVARQRNEALMRLDALLASTAQRQGCREMKPDWYTANDWSKLPAGGNSLRQIFVRLEDWEAVLAESERALSVCSKGFDAMCKRALAAEARIRDLEAFLVKVLPAGIEDVCDECGGDLAKCKAENPDCYIAEARRLLPASVPETGVAK